MFGHERGAFTGAVESRQGWFERADGGTLLLDEMGELPLAAQVRLLRILQDGWLERVGGHSPIHVDVRIVAATHRDLAAMVAAGKFREDLWYRIAVFPIHLPPLRERQEDIAVAGRALRREGRHAVRPAAGHALAARTSRLLRAYSWPGNIRELATVIDRAAILGNGRAFGSGDRIGRRARSPPWSDPTASRPNPPISNPAPRILSLDEAMKRHIESALATTHGRIEGPYGTARLLEINPHTLEPGMRQTRHRLEGLCAEID